MKEFDISFSYIIDIANVAVTLQAQVSVMEDGAFYVHSYKLNGKSIGLLEMIIRKYTREWGTEWVHVDSGLPSSISQAAGKAIDHFQQ